MKESSAHGGFGNDERKVEFMEPCMCRVVDFGPGMDVNYAFSKQQSMNPKGQSAPICSEY